MKIFTEIIIYVCDNENNENEILMKVIMIICEIVYY